MRPVAKEQRKPKFRSPGMPAVKSPKSRRRPGRPAKGEEITFEEYRDALQKSEGRYIGAAEIIGCTLNAVSDAIDRWPELKEIRRMQSVKRCEVARSVIDQMLDPNNQDNQLKLRAATFSLQHEDPDFNKSRTEISGTLSLPPLVVNFLPGSNADTSEDGEGSDD